MPPSLLFLFQVEGESPRVGSALMFGIVIGLLLGFAVGLIIGRR